MARPCLRHRIAGKDTPADLNQDRVLLINLSNVLRKERQVRRSRTPARAGLSSVLAMAVFVSLTLPVGLAAQKAAGNVGRVSPGEVRPGLTGYGLTVFSGTSPDTFAVTVLGVQHGARAGGDVILVELSGHDLELTAVARGMSGSPVYLDDGRLLGAVAFGWPGALRAIAGLTPAGDLDHVRDRPSAAHASVSGELLGFRGEGVRHIEVAALLDLPSSSNLAIRMLSGGDDGQRAASILSASAVERGVVSHEAWPTPEKLALRLLKTTSTQTVDAPAWLAQRPVAASSLVPLELGFYALPAGMAAAAVDLQPTLAAGSSCAIALVYGDASLGAMGTVSLVEGSRVVLMAHPFLQLGPVDLPLAAASVITLFPSRELSFKMGSAGPVVGRITHDLRAGLAGVLGESAPTVPVDVDVEFLDGYRNYSFQVALQPELTPQLVFWCLYNALLAEGDDRSQQLVRFDISIGLRGRDGRKLPDIALRGATGGPGGVNALQSDWQAPLQLLLANRHEPLVPTEVKATLRVEKPLRTAWVVALYAPARIAPGETFAVEVELDGRHGPRWRERFDLRAPDNLQPGTLRLGAASARDFFRLDALRAGGLFEDHSLAAMMELLNRPRSPEELTVAMIAPAPGFTVAGRELAGLPASVRYTLAAGPPGAVRPTMAAYVLRDSRHTGRLLQGDAVRDIEVSRPPSPRSEGARP